MTLTTYTYISCAQAGPGPTVPEERGFEGQGTCFPDVTQTELSAVLWKGGGGERILINRYTSGLGQQTFVECLL